MSPNSTVLIVTRSILLANGLDALLRAMPQIDDVKLARSLYTAFQQIRQGQPRIALIDSVLLGGEPGPFMDQISRSSPETRRVILLDEVQAAEWVPEYAEALLVKGASPLSLAATITGLLTKEGEQNDNQE